MTNEEREALIAQGWTPPVTVDPDEHLAITYSKQLFDFRHPLNIDRAYSYLLGAIKEGRALAAAEAKPGLVWVKHDGSGRCPAPWGAWVTNRNKVGGYISYSIKIANDCDWSYITHYAVITPPAEDE